MIIMDNIRTLRVAPVRERGLKFSLVLLVYTVPSRSREGAWIEIEDIFKLGFVTISRSREGAWIEIYSEYYELSNY